VFDRAVALLGRRAERFTASELSDDEKPPILRAYLERWKCRGTGRGPNVNPKHPIFGLFDRLGLVEAPERRWGLADVPQPVRAGSREVLKVARALTPTHRHLRSRLVFLFIATVILDAVASVLIFAFERHAPGTEITNLGDSVFWTSTQLLTVSSQLPNPISTPARVLDVFLQAYAISAVAILAGSFGAFFHRRGMERDAVNEPAGRG
jgi:hypothetical protein